MDDDPNWMKNENPEAHTQLKVELFVKTSVYTIEIFGQMAN